MWDWGAVLGLVEEGLGVDCVEGASFGAAFFNPVSAFALFYCLG